MPKTTDKVKAHKACADARKAYDEAWKAYADAGKAYDKACGEAWKACEKARKAKAKANEKPVPTAAHWQSSPSSLALPQPSPQDNLKQGQGRQL